MKDDSGQSMTSPQRQGVLLWVCFAIILFAATWVLLDHHKWRVIYQEMSESISLKTSLETEVRQAKFQIELQQLQQQLVTLEMATQVDQVAQNETRKALKKIEQENLQLREELIFYQEILLSTKDSRGLKIQGVRIAERQEKQHYQLELVLTRIIKGVTVTDGEVEVVISGNDKTGSVDYDLKKLSVDPDFETRFEIQHFKRIGTELVLPEDFTPLTVKVLLISLGGEESSLPEQLYSWADIAN